MVVRLGLAVASTLISLAVLSVGLLSQGRQSSAAPLAIISEGVAHVGADAWRQAGLRGQGVRIGVLDAGFRDYDKRIQEGELPSDVITHTFRTVGSFGAGDEHGTVMAEIAFDLAPEAQFYFVNMLPTDVSQFGQAVDWLIEQEVDIVLYGRNWLVGSSGDGRGPVTAKVDEANQNGILWVSSAGDAAQRHWEGEWQDLDGCPPALDPLGSGGGCLDFAPGDNWNGIPNVLAGQLISVGLIWDDRWEQNAEINYNLALSFHEQPPDWISSQIPGAFGYPVEQIDATVRDDGTYSVAITRPPEETRSTQVELFIGWDPNLKLERQVITSSIMTPADALGALVVGAADWRDDGLEASSSRGPTNDGRIKPDLVAPDGVRTVTYWIPEEGVTCPQPGSGACGTGVAAAHVAGAAALVKSAFPSFAADEIAAFLRERALDLGPAGPDNDYGWGRLQLGRPPGQATVTPTATGQPPTPTPTATISPSPTATTTPGVRLYLPAVMRAKEHGSPR
ncbi:MAG: S8 family serine peptidase [Anaerolineae bacterium]